MARSRIFEQLPREESRHQMVVQRLRNAIAQGRLAVGEHLLSERELCEQLGVSRTIVREAIRVLASQGILTVRQGRRAVVATDLSTASLRPMRQLIEDTARETFGDVLDARLILEVAGAERAATKASEADIAAMAEALEALRSASAGSDTASRAHTAFHAAVARASHNNFLASMVESLIESHLIHDPRRASAAEVPEDLPLLPVGYEAHARIFRPIQAHSVAGARRAMHEHLNVTIHHHPDLQH
ncbi:MAG: transcriptional regulator, GntR family [Chloroflexi bacterium]|nr:transcriptional regulator, GntR family [Chloroflexota bacterium]